MKAGGGKAKGSEFERQVCKTLSLWISDGERDDIFWRSAMSGGRATLAIKKGSISTAHAGDITPTHSLGFEFLEQFMVECKFYKDLNVESLIFGTSTGEIYKFFDKEGRTVSTSRLARAGRIDQCVRLFAGRCIAT